MGAPLKKNSQESSEAFTATTQQKSTFRRSIFSRFSLALKYYLYERLLYRKQLNKFWELLGGHIFFQTVSSAVELDLFNVLEKNGPSSIEQISFALNLKEQPCRILLLGLVTCGAVSKKKNLYFNSPLAKRFLVSNAPWKLANCFRWQSHINYIPMSRFTEALQSGVNVGLQDFPGNGNTLYERLVSNPEKEKIFQDSMEELSKLSNNQLAQFVDFSKTKTLIDVGGGNGTNIIEIAKLNPHLTAKVFDSPSVCAIARANIESHNLSNRLGAIEGNIFKDELPQEAADCVIFCHFFTMWSLDEDLELLKKAHRGLKPGGKVIIFNMMQNNNGDGPRTAAIGSPYFLTLATGRGMLYTWDQYEQLFAQAGFPNIETIKLLHDHGAIVGYKP